MTVDRIGFCIRVEEPGWLFRCTFVLIDLFLLGAGPLARSDFDHFEVSKLVQQFEQYRAKDGPVLHRAHIIACSGTGGATGPPLASDGWPSDADGVRQGVARFARNPAKPERVVALYLVRDKGIALAMDCGRGTRPDRAPIRQSQTGILRGHSRCQRQPVPGFHRRNGR